MGLAGLFCEMIDRRTFLGLVAATPWAMSAAAEEKLDNLNEVLSEIRESNGLPALAVAASKGGKVLGAGAVGVRKVGSAVAVTLSDKFHIGSDTKAMTATLVAMQVEQGKVRWEQTLSEIFPERAPKMNEAFRKVTLEMLLTHRAGLPANTHNYGSAKDPVTSQRLSAMDAVINAPPVHEPGTDFLYSNAGYIIVGAILERITGKAWEALIQEKLFRPLGMTSAGFGPPSKPGQTDQPWGHVLKDAKFKPAYGDNPPALGPAGTVHCDILDYMKFADLHTSNGKRPTGLVSPELMKALHTPGAGRTYAMGWGTGKRTWANGGVLSHAGSNTMNYFMVWLAPEIDFAVAAAVNAAGGKVQQAADQAISKCIQKYVS